MLWIVVNERKWLWKIGMTAIVIVVFEIRIVFLVLGHPHQPGLRCIKRVKGTLSVSSVVRTYSVKVLWSDFIDWLILIVCGSCQFCVYNADGFMSWEIISMADSDVLEITEESELVVLPQLDDDEKDTLTFAASDSQELLVDVNEVGLSHLFPWLLNSRMRKHVNIGICTCHWVMIMTCEAYSVSVTKNCNSGMCNIDGFSILYI